MALLKSFPGVTLFCLLCLSAVTADAQGTWFQQFNCAMTLPAGPLWNKPPPVGPGVRAAAQTNDRTASIMLTIVPLPNPSTKIDAKFIEQFEMGYFPVGKSKKISGVQLVLQGVPAYKATGEIYINGKTIQTAMYLWLADGRAYQIAALKLNTPPLEDAEIQTAMNSFHFLNTPKF